MKKFFKISLVALTTMVLVASPFSATPAHLGEPKKAQAISVFVTGGRLDIVKFIPQLTSIQASTATETGQSLFEWAQRFVREVLRKRLLDMVVDDIIGWINGEGDPRFVTDWNAFLEEAANVALSALDQELGGALCAPFNFRINIQTSQTRFQNSITCTLDQIVGNIENFYNDFSNGGWIAYSQTIEPQNDFYGSYFMSLTEAQRRVDKAVYAADKEATIGGGFLSTKDCVEVGDTSDPKSGPDIDRDGKYGDTLNCKITTPGSVVAHLANQAVGIDIPYLLSAQEFETYLAAIVNALINRLLRVGVEGLQGLSSNSSQGSDFLPEAQACLGLTGAPLQACQQYFESNRGNFASARESLLLQIDLALAARQEADAIFSDVLARSQSYRSLLLGVKQTDPHCVLDADIESVNQTIDQATASQAENRISISQLQAAKLEVQRLNPANWQEYTRLNSQLTASANIQLAQSVKDSASTLRTDLFSTDPDSIGTYAKREIEVRFCANF